MSIEYPIRSARALSELYATLSKRIERCVWKENLPAEYGFDPRGRVAFRRDHIACHICVIDQYIVSRLGPFVSKGGFDWHDAYHHDIFLLSESKELEKDIFFLSTNFVALNGSILGYPPLHLHHSHLYPNTRNQFQHLLNAHQDSSCTADAGGEVCSSTWLEAGYSMKILDAVAFDLAANDVRALGSQPMSFYVQNVIGIQYGNQTLRSVVQWRMDSLPNFPNGPKCSMTFCIPADRGSIVWSTTTFPLSGRMVGMWVHTHPTHGFDELWYLDAAPIAMGILPPATSRTALMRGYLYADRDKQPTNVAHFGKTGFIDTNGLPLKKWKDAFHERFRRLGVRIRCAQTAVYYDINLGDRQPHLNCSDSSDRMQAGDIMTIIAFFDPLSWIPSPESKWYPQHMHVQAYVAVEEATPYRVYQDWAWDISSTWQQMHLPLRAEDSLRVQDHPWLTYWPAERSAIFTPITLHVPAQNGLIVHQVSVALTCAPLVLFLVTFSAFLAHDVTRRRRSTLV